MGLEVVSACLKLTARADSIRPGCGGGLKVAAFAVVSYPTLRHVFIDGKLAGVLQRGIGVVDRKDRHPGCYVVIVGSSPELGKKEKKNQSQCPGTRKIAKIRKAEHE